MRSVIEKIEPRCSAFGECGGCQFQHLAYADELAIKETGLNALFKKAGLPTDIILPIEPSPKEYHYRCRLDMKFLKIKSGKMFMGFSPVSGFSVLEVSECLLAMETISSFLPELKRLACEKIPAKYRHANLTVKTGDDGRVCWGGIGRRSLRMNPEDFLWTEIEDQRIFYSLDTFFQANLTILPRLMNVIRSFEVLDQTKIFFDLYGGVGLFGFCFSKDVGRVMLIEENTHAIRCARHSVMHNKIENLEMVEGRVEDKFSSVLEIINRENAVAMIDPPRSGLGLEAKSLLNSCQHLNTLIYLSCNPQTLVCDLTELCAKGWNIIKIVPFDFFPKTKHLETLVLLKRL